MVDIPENHGILEARTGKDRESPRDPLLLRRTQMVKITQIIHPKKIEEETRKELKEGKAGPPYYSNGKRR